MGNSEDMKHYRELSALAELQQRRQSDRHAERSVILAATSKAEVLEASFWTVLTIGQSAKPALHIQTNLCTTAGTNTRDLFNKGGAKRLKGGLLHPTVSIQQPALLS